MALGSSAALRVLLTPRWSIDARDIPQAELAQLSTAESCEKNTISRTEN